MDIIFAIVLGALFLYFLLNFRPGPPRRAISKSSSNFKRLPEESLGTFIVCAFSMLGKLSQVDGYLSEEEVARVHAYIDTTLCLRGKTRDLAISVFKESAGSPLDIRDYAERFQKAFSDKVNLADELVRILLEIGASDGMLGLEEERSIRSVALLIGLSEPGFERIKKQIIGDTPIVH